MITCNWYNVVFHQCTHSCQRWLRLLSRLLNMNNILEQVNIKSLIVDDISTTGFAGWWMKSGSKELLTLDGPNEYTVTLYSKVPGTRSPCIKVDCCFLHSGTTSASISSWPRISWWLLHSLIMYNRLVVGFGFGFARSPRHLLRVVSSIDGCNQVNYVAGIMVCGCLWLNF